VTRDACTLRGHGVHTGTPVTVRLHRTEGAVTFLRQRTRIPARGAFVVDTHRATVLQRDGAQVVMVEHLLAALHIHGIWSGLTIETDADELPIFDGSAQPLGRRR
jgi:UDP-3-O-acyl-N-acetylglucosamine deacetylase